MKKLIYLILFGSISFAQTNVVVSIAPLKLFVKKIGGDRVKVSTMVKSGTSPHNYEPKASQMRSISRADIYFAIGVEFEEIWLDKFKNQNSKLIVEDSSNGVLKLPMLQTHHHKEVNQKDPHVWVDPLNVKIIAKNIYNTLIIKDKNSTNYYKNNLEIFLKELDSLDLEIRDILKKSPKESKFMVFHPSWGYFAKRYTLKQLPVEIEGKEPKMKELIKLIKEAKKSGVSAIFVQPEFSDKSAKIIAKNLDIEVIKTSPLAKNWAENLKTLAKAIATSE